MNKDISIIPVRKDHIKEIIDILQSVSEYKPSYDQLFDIWKDFSNQSNYYGFVALFNGEVVGYGSIFFVVKIRGGKMGQIDEIATHKDFRMKGISQLILNSLYELAIKEKCYKICLTCKKNYIHFYEKQNFSLEGFHLNKFL